MEMKVIFSAHWFSFSNHTTWYHTAFCWNDYLNASFPRKKNEGYFFLSAVFLKFALHSSKKEFFPTYLFRNQIFCCLEN